MQFTASAPQYAFGPAMAPVPMMAEGGLAAAAQARSQGRGSDTMLVHMDPSEVKGLQALAMAHGGSLTINPDTGLPEAGFLKKILPMVIGAALTPLTGGVINPMTAGLIVGAGYTAATGSLKKGLMAGLSAYGGAGLTQGLAAAGAGAGAGEAAAGFTPVPSAPTVTPDVVANPGVDMTVQTPMPSVPPPSQGILAQSPSAPQFTPVPSAPSGLASAVQAAPPAATTGPLTMGQQFQTVGRGLENVVSMGPEGTAAREAFMKAAPTGTLPSVGTSLLSAVTPEPEKPATSPAYEYDYQYDWNKQAGAFNPPASSGAGSAERRYFDPTYTLLEKKRITAAGGGLMGLSQGGYSFDRQDDEQGYAEGGYKRPKARSLTGEGFYKFAQDRKDSSMEASVEQNFAKGGLGAASKSLPPRFLEGAGDGMSDSIKASIGGVQEARLADGEFVVPADVVSHLGNGSSKAGAKKLYAMMDKIRKARTGRERQAPEVNAAKYMPA